ncbi:hypothetical protein RJ40_00485 [Methanofollis aquaemaris]|uniref:Uncharacterized protein n=1 Tax=Methanofollis aquaemaris TaxID=126734 RepID=A0A8A3S397_9EURY|nr:hypothetical protein [Methanofollis aquaemaris]QSZ66084.1 hypothetical protein RJ40_00485 [Methanofollis aquaemaris]
MKQIAIGLAVLLLIIGGTTLLPVEHPQSDEDVHRGIEVVGPYGVQEISEVTCDIALPEYPEKVMVYRTVDTIVSKDDAQKIAEKFGMSGPVEESRSGIWYVIKDDPYTFEIEKETGYMTYTWEGRWKGYNTRDRPQYLPTDEEARKIAETFLTSHDLMPEGAIYSSVSHGQRIFSNHKGEAPIVTYKDSKVLFTGTLSNLSVAGNGIYVTVGGDGDILKVAKRWREAEPYREFKIISPENAIKELKQTGVVTTVSSPREATIDTIKLCYYASPPGDEQPYLKPTYSIRGSVEGEKGTGTFFQYVPAVPELGKGLY